ncbi:hypothetical protein Tco_1523125 [Tanacetum coccineum]
MSDISGLINTIGITHAEEVQTTLTQNYHNAMSQPTLRRMRTSSMLSFKRSPMSITTNTSRQTPPVDNLITPPVVGLSSRLTPEDRTTNVQVTPTMATYLERLMGP